MRKFRRRFVGRRSIHSGWGIYRQFENVFEKNICLLQFIWEKNLKWSNESLIIQQIMSGLQFNRQQIGYSVDLALFHFSK